MLVLAAGCLLAGLAVRPLFAGLVLPLGTVLDQPAHVIAAHLAPALGPLTAIVIVNAIAIGLIAVLSLWRHQLLRSREVHTRVTWDCGYAVPTARMQYTSTSFAQPLVDFFSLILRTRKHISEPVDLFPAAASAEIHHDDTFLDGLFARSYRGLSWALSQLHWLQHGHLNLYVLYIALTLVTLLAWQFGLSEFFHHCVRWLAMRPASMF
jgi:hydrogenase-4 component B